MIFNCHTCRHSNNLGAVAGCNLRRQIMINPHRQCADYEPRTKPVKKNLLGERSKHEQSIFVRSADERS